MAVPSDSQDSASSSSDRAERDRRHEQFDRLASALGTTDVDAIVEMAQAPPSTSRGDSVPPVEISSDDPEPVSSSSGRESTDPRFPCAFASPGHPPTRFHMHLHRAGPPRANGPLLRPA